MNDLDRRTARGRELAQRLNKQTILENMPKIAYLKDDYNRGYRYRRLPPSANTLLAALMQRI